MFLGSVVSEEVSERLEDPFVLAMVGNQVMNHFRIETELQGVVLCRWVKG